MDDNELVLSTLPKTWLFDLDGTVVKHNGYLHDGVDTLLIGSVDFINSLPKTDKVIFLTSRSAKFSK